MLTFEPLLTAYSELTSRYSKRKDTRKPLGWHHARGIAMPVAIAPAPERFARFSLANVDGCSSLLPPNKRANWGKFCLETAEVRSVPTMSLHRVLSMLPPGREVHHLKVDAQGFDLSVVESAGSRARLIRSVQLEVIVGAPSCTPLQVGAPTCVQAVRRMRSLNFTAYKAEWHTKPRKWRHAGWTEDDCTRVVPIDPNNGRSTNCEVDIFFHRADLQAPKDDETAVEPVSKPMSTARNTGRPTAKKAFVPRHFRAAPFSAQAGDGGEGLRAAA